MLLRMTSKTKTVLLFLFWGTGICSGIAPFEYESSSASSKHTLTGSANIPAMSLSSSPRVISTTGFDAPSSTPELRKEPIHLFATLIKAPTTISPEMQFETKATDPPKLLLSGLVASLDFVDDYMFEELRLEVPKILSNDTASLSVADENRFEELRRVASIRPSNKTAKLMSDNSKTDMVRLTNISTEAKQDYAEVMSDRNNSADAFQQQMKHTSETSIGKLKVYRSDQKRTNLQHSEIFYGKTTYLNPTYKYMYPVILGTCLLATFGLVTALIRKQRQLKSQLSKASCILLISVAVADSVTMGVALAEVSYRFRTTEENHGLLPFEACKVMHVLERLSAVPHAASTWLTVILAVQRYLCVSMPFSAGQYITVKSVLIYAIFVCMFSIVFHVYRFFDFTFVSVAVSLYNVTTTSCYARYEEWITDPHLYESIFAWSRIFLMQLLPSLLIVTFVILMNRSLRKATLKRECMKAVDDKLNPERRKLTIFVAAIALIVFSVETSSGLFLSLNAWELTTGQTLIPYDTLKTASVAFDLILYISYFMVFLLYCLMSKELRSKIVHCCIISRGNGLHASMKSMTLTSRLPASKSGSCNHENTGGVVVTNDYYNHHIVTKL